MICYVDMEHPSALREPRRRAEHAVYCAKIRRKLEDASSVDCIVQPYSAITHAWLDFSAVQALILGGNATDWCQYTDAELSEIQEIIREAQLPMLGLCGGLQLIAMAYGARLGPMRRLVEGEPDPEDGYAPGYFKEWGFERVEIVQPDPLFEGLVSPVFLEAHYWEVQEMPCSLQLLASTGVCRIQAIKQVGKPVYGTQFHPESYIVGGADAGGWLLDLVYPDGYTEYQPDGRTLLTNFFRVAGILG